MYAGAAAAASELSRERETVRAVGTPVVVEGASLSVGNGDGAWLMEGDVEEDGAFVGTELRVGEIEMVSACDGALVVVGELDKSPPPPVGDSDGARLGAKLSVGPGDGN